jgi:tight adherence protein B
VNGKGLTVSILLLGVIIFLLALLVIELSFYAYRAIMHPDRSEVRRRLRQSLAEESVDATGSILKKEVFSDVPFINRGLALVPGIERLQLVISQANVQYTLGFFMLFSLTLGFAGYLLGTVFSKNTLLSVPAALAAASLPLFYVQFKKKKRMGQFEKQLPEALGLIARALRAGHAFTSGMKLAAEEFGDPLGPYFADTLDEINFGVGVADALKNLALRVDCPDMRFFVISVILQRETGGNLAEIIEGLAHLIRERFKFRGKVRTLSAEGRLTGKILVAVPVVLFWALYLLNPEYAGQLIHDPIGKLLIAIAVGLMGLAGWVIRRTLKVDV